MSKTGRIVGIVVVVVLVALAVYMFVDSVTPYTQDFEEAKSGKTLQVWGMIDLDSVQGNSFNLMDEVGNSLPVISQDMLPPEFENSSSTVCIGSWDGQSFIATKVLLKCPSKYNEEKEQ